MLISSPTKKFCEQTIQSQDLSKKFHFQFYHNNKTTTFAVDAAILYDVMSCILLYGITRSQTWGLKIKDVYDKQTHNSVI